MDEAVRCNQNWPDEARMPVGRGLPEDLLLLWETDGWSCASVIVTVAAAGGGVRGIPQRDEPEQAV